MPRLSGGPNRYFPTSNATINQEKEISSQEPPKSLFTPLTVKQPTGAADLVPGGATLTIETTLSMKVCELQADIPTGCTASIQFDGQEVHTTTDAQGNVGSLKFGDLAAGIGLQIGRVRVAITNNTAGSLNARYWLVGFA